MVEVGAGDGAPHHLREEREMESVRAAWVAFFILAFMSLGTFIATMVWPFNLSYTGIGAILGSAIGAWVGYADPFGALRDDDSPRKPKAQLKDDTEPTAVPVLRNADRIVAAHKYPPLQVVNHKSVLAPLVESQSLEGRLQAGECALASDKHSVDMQAYRRSAIFQGDIRADD